MKFHQVPIGGRFLLDGEVHVKTTALIGVIEASGKQCLIRRSAEVQSVETAPSSTASQEEALIPSRRARVLLEAYHRHCLECLANFEPLVEGRRLEHMEQDLTRLLRELTDRLESDDTP